MPILFILLCITRAILGIKWIRFFASNEKNNVVIQFHYLFSEYVFGLSGSYRCEWRISSYLCNCFELENFGDYLIYIFSNILLERPGRFGNVDRKKRLWEMEYFVDFILIIAYSRQRSIGHSHSQWSVITPAQYGVCLNEAVPIRTISINVDSQRYKIMPRQQRPKHYDAPLNVIMFNAWKKLYSPTKIITQ